MEIAFPKYLYKFRSFRSENHERILTDRELYFPSPDKFNDPFDCSIAMRYEDFNKQEFLRYWIDSYKREHPGIPDHDARQWAKEFYKKSRTPEGNRAMVQAQMEVMAEIRSGKIGVFSLSANLKSILSWSHYADCHTGFCIGFHTINLKQWIDQSGSLELNPVLYSMDYPLINAYRMSDEEKTKMMLSKKSREWEYEAEYRIIWWTGANQRLRIEDGIIRRIVLGCEVSPRDRDRIIAILRSFSNRVSLFQARRKEDRYSLDFRYVRYA